MRSTEIIFLLGFVALLVVPIVLSIWWVGKANTRFFAPYFRTFSFNPERPEPQRRFKATAVKIGKKQWGTFFGMGEDGSDFFIRIPSVGPLWIPFSEIEMCKVRQSFKDRQLLTLVFKNAELMPIDFMLSTGAYMALPGLKKKVKL